MMTIIGSENGIAANTHTIHLTSAEVLGSPEQSSPDGVLRLRNFLTT